MVTTKKRPTIACRRLEIATLVPRSGFQARLQPGVRRHCNALDNDERRQAMRTSDTISRPHITRRVLLSAGAAGAVMVTAGTVLAQQPAPAPQTPRVQGPPVWLDMDQAELDAAYDQSVYAPNLQQLTKRYATNSEDVRTRLGAPQRYAYGATPVEGLDVYLTKRPNAPINLFFHGGAWRTGLAKNYAFPVELFVHAGAHCIVPDFAWVQDVD